MPSRIVPSKRQRTGTCKLASLHVSPSQANFFPRRTPQPGVGGGLALSAFGSAPFPLRIVGRRARLALGCNLNKTELDEIGPYFSSRIRCQLCNAAQGANGELPDRSAPLAVSQFEGQRPCFGPAALERLLSLSVGRMASSARSKAEHAFAPQTFCRQSRVCFQLAKVPGKARAFNHRTLRCTFTAIGFEGGRNFFTASLHFPPPLLALTGTRSTHSQ